MNSQQIRSFLCVAACKNFTMAGEQLFLSQPVISYHIKALEKELGFRLLERDTHGVRLTEAGQSYYRSMCDISERYKEALETAERIAFKDSGSLRICFANPTLPAMMGQIVNRLYNILELEKIELTRRSYDDVLQPLLSRTADILFSYPHFFREGLGLNMKRFCRVWTSCMMWTGHPLSCKRSLVLSDLRGQRLLFPDSRNIRTEFAEVCELMKDTDSEAPVIDDTPQTFEQVQGLAMAGRGIMLVRTMDNLYHDNMDGLVSIPIMDLEPDYMVAIWHEGTLCASGRRLVRSIPEV